MTKLYANLQHHQHHHQVTFKSVDQRRALKAESMSSLSDVSDDLPPPNDNVISDVIPRPTMTSTLDSSLAFTASVANRRRSRFHSDLRANSDQLTNCRNSSPRQRRRRQTAPRVALVTWRHRTRRRTTAIVTTAMRLLVTCHPVDRPAGWWRPRACIRCLERVSSISRKWVDVRCYGLQRLTELVSIR